MPLKTNPLTLTDLSWLGVETEVPSAPREVIQRTNMATYLAGMFCLGHGRRDLLPLTVLWHRAMAAAHLTHPVPEGQPATEEWCGQFFSLLEDWLHQMATTDVALLPFEWGSDDHFNILNALVRAQEKLARRGWDDDDDILLGCLALSDREELLLGFVGHCSGTGSLVSGQCQLAATQIIAAGDCAEADKAIHSASLAISSSFGNNFTHVPAQVIVAYCSLKGKADMEDVWARATESFCQDGEEVDLPEPPEDEDRETRRNRRWLNGRSNDESYECRERVFAQSMGEAVESLEFSMRERKVTVERPRLIQGLALVSKYIKDELDNFVPMTFFNEEAYAAFSKSGHTVSFWDLVKRGKLESTWHSRYTDVPIHGRAVNDRRLYGEKGRNITYGALIHRGMTDQISTLAGMYGKIVVTWKGDCLRHSTGCLNDSQTSPFVLPLTQMMKKKLAVAFMAPRLLNLDVGHPFASLISEAFGGHPCFPNFIECQIHDRMTMTDVDDVMDLS